MANQDLLRALIGPRGPRRRPNNVLQRLNGGQNQVQTGGSVMQQMPQAQSGPPSRPNNGLYPYRGVDSTGNGARPGEMSPADIMSQISVEMDQAGIYGDPNSPSYMRELERRTNDILQRLNGGQTNFSTPPAGANSLRRPLPIINGGLNQHNRAAKSTPNPRFSRATFDAQDPRQESALNGQRNSPVDLVGTAANLIKGFEGHRTNPYMDAGTWRSGFGSDTVTSFDGKVSSVLQGVPTTMAASERDLRRRISTEFMPRAEHAIGAAWKLYSPEQKAAFTSIAYNYGSLPSRHGLLKAAKAGDVGAVNKAIIALGNSDNNGTLLSRRRVEASAFPQSGNNGVASGAPLVSPIPHPRPTGTSLSPITSPYPNPRPANLMQQGFMDQPQTIQQAAIGNMQFGNSPQNALAGMGTQVAGNFKVPTGYMVDPKNSNRLEPIPGGPKDLNRPTTSSLNKVFAINNATKSLNEGLDNYLKLVDKYGIELAPGIGKDSLDTTRRIIQMQMKELFNLGVLNGPDLDLMDQMLIDVTSLQGAASGLIGGILGSSIKERAKNNIRLLKQNFEMLRRNQTPKGYGSAPQQSDADFLKSLGLK